MSKGSSPQKQSTVRLYCVLLTDPVPCLGSLSNVEGVITPKTTDGSTALRFALRSFGGLTPSVFAGNVLFRNLLCFFWSSLCLLFSRGFFGFRLFCLCFVFKLFAMVFRFYKLLEFFSVNCFLLFKDIGDVF